MPDPTTYAIPELGIVVRPVPEEIHNSCQGCALRGLLNCVLLIQSGRVPSCSTNDCVYELVEKLNRKPTQGLALPLPK